jgi:hypothetical protein
MAGLSYSFSLFILGRAHRHFWRMLPGQSLSFLAMLASHASYSDI